MSTQTKHNIASRILTEDMLSLGQAAREFPGGVHPATVYRWQQRGVKGVRLETYRIGAKLVTSKQAIARFLDALQSPAGS
ncbi:MAG: DUF1580 domain-containing protein [Planctomycetales bacterium]|nr:DUF1580 domain-containing protein [Planctomycetales bacterium]